MKLGVNSPVLYYNKGAYGINNVFSYFKTDNWFSMGKGESEGIESALEKWA